MGKQMSLPWIDVDRPAPRWQGREDGAGAGHRRWHQLINEQQRTLMRAGDFILLGFSSDAGVRRNQGRVGAAEGPAALRRALGSLAVATGDKRIFDLGDIIVDEDELEAGQERLSATVQKLVTEGFRPVLLGGGHETVYGSFLGVHAGQRAGHSAKLGVLNLDAHFDLRQDTPRSSGTPFWDIAEELRQRSAEFHYAVIGISRPSNTAALFDTAQRLGVDYLLDEHCMSWNRDRVAEFLARYLKSLDSVQLSVDLDVLPASVAPGVSAPSGLGVPMEIILDICQQVAASGKLALFEVVELNPRLDIDQRTARSAARLIESTLSHWR